MLSIEIKMVRNKKEVTVLYETKNTFHEAKQIAINECGKDGYIKFLQEEKSSRDLRARTPNYIIDIMY